MKPESFYEHQYKARFSKEKSVDADSIQAAALSHALDIRKFEIDLYWKRASYFWTFIGAALAGYVAVQASNSLTKTSPSILLSCLGLVFSFAWLLANRGSKYWQENWENHVDMLEDAVTGPLYKVVLSRRKPSGHSAFISHALTGPSPFSVSKINQLLSLFVTLIWIVLLFTSLPPFSIRAPVNWTYSLEVTGAMLTCIALFILGRTHEGDYHHQGSIRHASIDGVIDASHRREEQATSESVKRGGIR